MISILKPKSVALQILFSLFLLFSGFLVAEAQTGQSITVSPTLFDVTATPGQVWQSELRIINSNVFDITIYTENVNFGTEGESGRPNFLKIYESETQGETLAEWITVDAGPILIPKQEAVTIPFTVTVPEDAPPGGHYAAILVGTRATPGEEGLVGAQTAQFVSSLLFLRVDGEVVESGGIRSFRAEQAISQTPEVNFSLRFENTGNVHLLPRGEIEIENMWGQSRGVIPVNQKTNFGKVLQNSIREFTFGWSGDVSMLDIGRYKATVTLGYGESESKFDTSTAYFWVIPYTTIGLILITVITVGALLIWLVRLYIRRMLSLAGIDVDKNRSFDSNAVVVSKYTRATAPVRSSVSVLRTKLTRQDNIIDKLQTIFKFGLQLRLFWAFVVVFIVVGYLGSVYMSSVTDTNRDFNVVIHTEESQVTRSLSSEEVYFEQSTKLEPRYVRDLTGYEVGLIPLEVVNTSGQLGVAARVARIIESYGFNISELSADFERQNSRTVILYTSDYQAVALALSKELDGALLSQVDRREGQDAKITILVGSDQIIDND